jgi:small nuclear ribonucleoprotein (snRNP)-like protein
VQLNGSRKVIGVLRGYDVRVMSDVSDIITDARQVFLNIVLDDAVEEKDGGEKVRLGMVVCLVLFSSVKPTSNVQQGYSRELRRYARGFGENRWGSKRLSDNHIRRWWFGHGCSTGVGMGSVSRVIRVV